MEAGDALKLLVEAVRETAKWEDMDSDRIGSAIASALYRLADTLEEKQS